MIKITKIIIENYYYLRFYDSYFWSFYRANNHDSHILFKNESTIFTCKVLLPHSLSNLERSIKAGCSVQKQEKVDDEARAG